MKKLLIFILISLAQTSFCAEKTENKKFDISILSTRQRRRLKEELYQYPDIQSLTSEEKEKLKKDLEEFEKEDSEGHCICAGLSICCALACVLCLDASRLR